MRAAVVLTFGMDDFLCCEEEEELAEEYIVVGCSGWSRFPEFMIITWVREALQEFLHFFPPVSNYIIIVGK